MNTANQKRAVEPVVLALQRSGYAVKTLSETNVAAQERLAIPELSRFLSLLLLPIVLLRTLLCIRTLQAQHVPLCYLLYVAIATFNMQITIWVIYLTVTKSQAVFLSNDHSPSSTALIQAAKLCEVKTYYLQHAHVVTQFPPLDFDVAFLDGELAAAVYDEQPSSTKVYLTGAPRLDSMLATKKRDFGSIGIALSLYDRHEETLALIDTLSALNLPITIRCHPAHGQERLEAISKAKGSQVALSNPKHETPDAFLQEVDLLFAANCSIHMEAALAGCACFYVVLSPDQLEDAYGFVKEGICIPFTSLDQIHEFISDEKRQKEQLLATKKLEARRSSPSLPDPAVSIVDIFAATQENDRLKKWHRHPRFQNPVFSYSEETPGH